MTMLLALTRRRVREHAVHKDVETSHARLLRTLRARGDAGGAAELESAAIAGHQRWAAAGELDALRTVAMVMAGGAQHLVVLRDALGARPLTEAFETAAEPIP